MRELYLPLKSKTMRTCEISRLRHNQQVCYWSLAELTSAVSNNDNSISVCTVSGPD